MRGRSKQTLMPLRGTTEDENRKPIFGTKINKKQHI